MIRVQFICSFHQFFRKFYKCAILYFLSTKEWLRLNNRLWFCQWKNNRKVHRKQISVKNNKLISGDVVRVAICLLFKNNKVLISEGNNENSVCRVHCALSSLPLKRSWAGLVTCSFPTNVCTTDRSTCMSIKSEILQLNYISQHKHASPGDLIT